MSDVVGYEVRGRVAVVTVDNPPVNALSHAVRQGLVAQIDRAADDDAVEAIVLIGAGRTFPAGADIREFDQPPREPHLLTIVDSFDSIEKPIVAAVHGTALGGGLELTLGCHFRVAAPAARVGTPEVKLGIFPGAAGTQRLPRVAGLDHALELIVLGEPIGAAKALDYGIVDEIVEGDLLDGAIAFAEKVLDEGIPRRISSEPKEGIGSPDDFAEVIQKYRDLAARRMRGQESPLEAIGSVIDGLEMPYDQAVAADRERFPRCKESDQSKALRYAFFAEREAAKIPGVGKDVSPRPVETGAVIGAGTMGGGIIMCFADSGIPVTAIETSQEALDRGLAMIAKNYQGMVDRGRIDEAEMARRLGLISTSLDYAGAGEADLIIEAAFEDIELKKEIFAKLDGVAKAGAILATNTSYMDINQIAAATGRPEDVIGLHFFVPANVMKMLEVVRTDTSSPEAVATGMRLARTFGKVGGLAGVSHGFVANRSRAPLVREANFLVEEGASPAQIDQVLRDFGMPMGVLAVSDLSGLDVSWRMRQSLAHLRDPEDRYPHLADRLCEMGRFGRKTGSGWFSYGEGGSLPVPDPQVDEIAVQVAVEQGIERRQIDDAEIRHRCLYAAVNEGAKIVEEGVALRASDIDIMWQYGFGFPRWRGGIMYHADRVGLPEVLARVEEFHATHGKLWQPSALLRDLAASGGSFTGT
ncbi:MAG: 3-hydroxyacyl-CoA dehydrogenase NAD-binding domain-containing protein [Alphaproteobacteria bacterium]|nr:3-hydroxyacyl-CoA dehydrogenase NAD-binding domain-containing protein [Alphaproteobacteria bacterium]MCZ6587624.1 3-hydroxyacyl-CoA dehydrogenase NAD-binding domain-containing protein [Alphaproteobacteria bacterium]